MVLLWREGAFRGTLRRNHARGALYVDRADLGCEQLPKFPLSDRLSRVGRSARHRSARVAPLPGCSAGSGVGKSRRFSIPTSTWITQVATRASWERRARRVLAHSAAASRIGGVDRGLGKGDVVRVGRTVELECLDTPGHTLSHVCLFARTAEPALFCGDTLFNAGAGNCHNGGSPELLYQTFAGQLARLPERTRVFPGHEYMARNLEFTLDREPDNSDASRRVATARQLEPAAMSVTTLGEEKLINTFFRLQSPTVMARLREVFPEIGAEPDAKTVFLKLRELRNKW